MTPNDRVFMRLRALIRAVRGICALNRGVSIEVHNHVKIGINIAANTRERFSALLLDCKKMLLIKGLI